MNAIMVAVNYTDLLAITLPYNRHHFEDMWIVTDHASHLGICQILADTGIKAGTHVTDAFYRNGATFNKWLALEEGLDAMGREGWICLMDADVLWPKSLQVRDQYETLKMWNGDGPTTYIDQGQLCTPRRRMWAEWPSLPPFGCNWNQRYGEPMALPLEQDWTSFPLHRQEREFAGYSQIFHANDPVLGPVPWHQADWKHAGGADSFFQQKWPAERKVRPPFEVLHLGPAGQNWVGRATPLVDGTVLPGSAERLDYSGRRLWAERRANRAAGRDQFDGERLK